MRAPRALVLPWVGRRAAGRPSKWRCIRRNIAEAETIRGPISASAMPRVKSLFIARPTNGMEHQPSVGKRSLRLAFANAGLR